MTPQPDTRYAEIRRELEEGIREAETEAAWYSFISLDAVRWLLDEAGRAAQAEAALETLRKAILVLIVETMSDDYFTCRDDYLSPGELAVREALSAGDNQ